jgi:hypothetical protein
MRLSPALLVSVLFVGAVGCSSGHSHGSQPPQVRHFPTAANHVTSAAVRSCALTQLAIARSATGEGATKDFGLLLVRNNGRHSCAMNQPISVTSVDSFGVARPLEGTHVVSPAASPWVLVSASDRHDPRPNALRRLDIVVTGMWAPDVGTTCSSPDTTPAAFRLTMGAASMDVPNQWSGPETQIGACRNAFSVGPAGRPGQLGLVPD